jgi:hypothetical protein
VACVELRFTVACCVSLWALYKNLTICDYRHCTRTSPCVSMGGTVPQPQQLCRWALHQNLTNCQHSIMLYWHDGVQGGCLKSGQRHIIAPEGSLQPRDNPAAIRTVVSRRCIDQVLQPLHAHHETCTRKRLAWNVPNCGKPRQ